MRFLEYLQSKPREVKAQYAALFAGIVTGAIAVVWVSTIPSRFASTPQMVTEDSESLSELIGDAKTQLGNAVSAEDASVANIGKNLNALTEGFAEPVGTSTGTFSENTSGGAVEEASTTSGEKRIIIETAKITPRTILIGTTTGGN